MGSLISVILCSYRLIGIGEKLRKQNRTCESSLVFEYFRFCVTFYGNVGSNYKSHLFKSSIHCYWKGEPMTVCQLN
jgi:hypothetical protein